MLRRILIISILGIISLQFSLFAAVNEYYIQLKNISPVEIDKLTNLVSIDSYKNGIVVANAIDKELNKLDELGFSYRFLPTKKHNFRMSDNHHDLRDWDSYPTYESYVSSMYQFAADFPEICQVQSMGYSVEGREILFAKISDNVTSEEAEPATFYSGQMHGDEVVCYILMLQLINYLTDNYGTDDRITNLVDNSEIWINPLANPDGTYAGGNDTINDATRRNANGVDLNRNFPDFLAGDHPDGEVWQPENIIMMDFAETHPIVLSANLHSGAEVVNYPWDTTIQRHADDVWWQYVSHGYADAVHEVAPENYMDGYDDGITNGYDWYTINGSRQDWYNYYANCREFTLELSNEKMLPEDELLDHWNYNREAFIGYLEEALYGIRGIVTDDSGSPLIAEITIVDHDNNNSSVYSSADVGDYYRPIEPGTYTLEFSAYGYITQLVENVSISNNNYVTVDASLVQADNTDISGTITSEEDDQPILGASVILLDTPYAEVFTDANGNYTIPEIFYNDYEIRIYAEGYSTQINSITVNESSNQFDFALYISTAISFENGLFGDDWEFSGSEDWFIDNSEAYDGNFSARSGEINHNQYSTLSLELNVTEAGTISFYKKVSCEDDTNNNYDFLKFSIDGTERDSWDGEDDWSLEEYAVSVGVHTFQWTYSKDNSVDNGDDCGWIDYVTLPVTNTSSNPSEINPVMVVLSNYPNPFNPVTTISFEISNEQNEQATIDIFNIKGQKIKMIPVNLSPESSLGKGEENTYSVTWNGTDHNNQPVASGIYFYQLNIDDKVIASKKCLLLK